MGEIVVYNPCTLIQRSNTAQRFSFCRLVVYCGGCSDGLVSCGEFVQPKVREYVRSSRPGYEVSGLLYLILSRLVKLVYLVPLKVCRHVSSIFFWSNI